MSNSKQVFSSEEELAEAEEMAVVWPLSPQEMKASPVTIEDTALNSENQTQRPQDFVPAAPQAETSLSAHKVRRSKRCPTCNSTNIERLPLYGWRKVLRWTNWRVYQCFPCGKTFLAQRTRS